jgi:phosphoribosylanthranilate isomerase
MSIDVKICGLKTAEAVDAAIEGGASMVGFVFYPPSPRCVTPFEAINFLKRIPHGVRKVALFVDPDDYDVGAVCRQLPVDLVQLHGHESLERVVQIKTITGLPVMKAVGIASALDIKLAHSYENICERILLDAKPPKDAPLPGGNALSFDWTLIANETWEKPWMLAGGLSVENLAEAVKISGATAVDVSSGVEEAPGQKSVQKIQAFLSLAKSL